MKYIIYTWLEVVLHVLNILVLKEQKIDGPMFESRVNDLRCKCNV